MKKKLINTAYNFVRLLELYLIYLALEFNQRRKKNGKI